MDFTKEEFEALNRFFDNQIANQSVLKEATRNFKRLISDRSIHESLRNRIIESFILGSGQVRIDLS